MKARRKPIRGAGQRRRSAQTRSRETQSITPPIPTSFRVGLGNDIHRLAYGRRLVLGGVTIPSKKGSVGHSDGDALAHAICDALLGAAGKGDIGRHFSDRSSKWQGVSSLLFLRHVRTVLDNAGLAIINLDCTVGLERPRLTPYMTRMQKRLASALRIRGDQISIKAKSGEEIGAVGRGEAVRADAVALVCDLRRTLCPHHSRSADPSVASSAR